MAKKEKTTLQEYNKWKKIHYSFKYGKYLAPLIPATVITGINWNEWFNQQGLSLPFGFATLLIAILGSIFAYSKSENESNNNNVSPFFYIGAILAMLGISFALLANILSQMGLMFLFTVMGIFGGGGLDQFDRTLVVNNLAEYKGLVETNQLDKKSQKRAYREEKARLESQQNKDSVKIKIVE